MRIGEIFVTSAQPATISKVLTDITSGGRAARNTLLVFCAAATMFATIFASGQTLKKPLVRIAELEIDSTQLSAYKDALKEEITTSVRLEPGVLSLSAVSVKDHPNQVRIFETYEDQAAYESHLQTPHFKKYKADTQRMVKSLKLIETDPILLGRK